MTEKNLELKEAPATGEAAGFDTWETSLQQTVGLTKDELRAIRKKKLVEKKHWVLNGRRICYSPAGVQELHRILEVTTSQKNAAAPQGGPREQLGVVKWGTGTMKVFRTGLKNDRVIEAHWPDQDPANPKNRLTVRVKNNRNFTVGMEIPVRVLRPGLYELARPCPRSKGKW